jgi:hypothetical protein
VTFYREDVKIVFSRREIVKDDVATRKPEADDSWRQMTTSASSLSSRRLF